jgi:hypothetical protein
MTSQNANSTAGDSSDLGTKQAGEASYDVAAKGDTSKPDAYEEQSAMRIALLLISVLLSIFLVALDRTIISTV